ncbi:MAG: tRNA lysidine(34) synthetase TilS [Polyangiaceae bacterium]
MSRSHPPTLLRLVERCAREECAVRRGEVLLVACSGGPDSMALLHALALLQDRLGVRVIGHGVDHGLRAEAAAELALAARFATSLQVPFGVSRLRVAAGGNLQERAREARHQALQAVGREAGASAIALGHTADDRAETVLMRLLRGAGPRGLAAMPPRAEGHPTATGARTATGAPTATAAGGQAPLPRVRPLLRVRRADVLVHLERHQVPSAADPTTEDPRFLRVRVRRELLPLLVELSPGIVGHLCALAEMLAAEPSVQAQAAAVAVAAAAGLPGLGRAQREAIERARRTGRTSARLRVRGGSEVTVSLAEAGIVVNPEGGRRRKRAKAKVDAGPEPARARKVPRSTAGGKGGMLVDSEKKGRAGVTPGPVTARPDRRSTQERPSPRSPRPPSRGSS